MAGFQNLSLSYHYPFPQMNGLYYSKATETVTKEEIKSRKTKVKVTAMKLPLVILAEAEPGDSLPTPERTKPW
jgi:hypothetical protein